MNCRRQRGRRIAAGAALALATAGCGPEVALPPITPVVALHPLPGAGYNLLQARTIFLVVDSQDLTLRTVLPRIAEIVSSELRAATPAEVVIVSPPVNRCSASLPWEQTCTAYDLHWNGQPQTVVMFCDVFEYDAYSPLRVGLAVRVKRLEDGLELAGVQGVWDRMPTAPLLPPHRFWSLPRVIVRRPNPRPWAEQVEDMTITSLMRLAARESVQSLIAMGPAAGPLPAALPEAYPTFAEPDYDSPEFYAPEDYPAPPAHAGPALPEPPDVGLDEAELLDDFSESAESVP
ncbi:MAG: hypothetical protein KF774_20145 [Planctomyces sp.]|nr:hypothetical protein [Planctomyces sp.]